ncbi:MAG: F0F1 ATP synthase subunit delta [Nocardioides sp.]
MSDSAGSFARGASVAVGNALAGALPEDASVAEFARAGDQLLAVATVIRNERALGRALADSSVPAPARVELADDVFAGQVDSLARQLLSTVVSSRWASPRELVRALEELSHLAVIKSSGDPARLAGELFAMARLIAGDARLRSAVSDPRRSATDKSELFEDLLADQALPATRVLLKRAALDEDTTVTSMLEHFQSLVAASRGYARATARVAQPLSPEHRERLVLVLARQAGQPVHLEEIIDEDVVGGIRVHLGDDLIDGSISSRISDARRLLAG